MSDDDNHDDHDDDDYHDDDDDELKRLQSFFITVTVSLETRHLHSEPISLFLTAAVMLVSNDI